MWVKFVEQWSHGNGEITYHFFDDPSGFEDIVEEIADSINQKNHWSEHYRGVNSEVVTKPSEQWLEQKIRYLTQDIAQSQKYLENLQKEWTTHYGQTPKS